MKTGNRLVLSALLIGMWGSSTAAPSFDCSRASTDVEHIICDTDYGTQEADRTLAARYSALRKSLPEEQARWLRESQRNWLRSRRQCLVDSKWRSARCLRELYQTRIAELERGIVVNPVGEGQLPYRVSLPNGVEGEFVLHATRTDWRLVLRTDDGEQELWHGGDVTPDREPDETWDWHWLTGLELVTGPGGGVVLAVHYDIERGEWGFREPHGWGRRYYALTADNTFVLQGVQEEVFERGYGMLLALRWDTAGADLLLKVDGHVIDQGNRQAQLFPGSRPRHYRLRFDGQPWQELVPEPQQWLHNPDAAVRYIALYRELMAGASVDVPVDYIDPENCPNDDINWQLAANGLRELLQLTLQAEQQGVAYADARAIAQKLLSAGQMPALNAEQRELLRGLDHLRRQIESDENWQETLDGMRTPWGGEGVYHYEQAMLEAFPELRRSCVGELDNIEEYRMYTQGWFHTFWLRRYRDGSYELARQVVEYALGQGEKAP